MNSNENDAQSGSDSTPLDANALAWPEAWPVAQLDPVSRMRVLAAGLPYCAVRETVLQADFDRVWSFLSDLEANTQRYERTVTQVKILTREPFHELIPEDTHELSRENTHALSRENTHESMRENRRVWPEERMRIASRSLPGVWMKMDVVLQEGWCVMHSRIGQIGFAAHPEANGSTRVIHFEGSPLFGRVVRPFFRWNVGRDFIRLAELLEE